MKISPYGFCANVRESPPRRLKSIYEVIPRDVIVGCRVYSLHLLGYLVLFFFLAFIVFNIPQVFIFRSVIPWIYISVAAFPIKHPVKPRYFHFITLVRDGKTFLEMCDMEPRKLTRPLTAADGENRLIQPVVAIYKSNIYCNAK